MAGDTAVPFRVPARFMAVGALALAAFWTAVAVAPRLALSHPALPGVLSLVHVFTLLFGASVLIGALHQLMPVLLVARLRVGGRGSSASGPLGDVVWAVTTAGAVAIVLGFSLGSRPVWLALGGTLMLIGVTLLLVALARTARAAARVDAVAATVLAAAVALWATVLLGAAIVLGRIVPELGAALGDVRPLHLTLGLAGAFALAIAGAGHKLLAMFVLSHGAAVRPLGWIGASVGGALAATALSVWLPGAWRDASFLGADLPTWASRAATLALGVALTALLVDVRAILVRRMRRRPDVGVLTYLIGLAGLVPAWALLALGRPADAVALLLVAGLAPAIAGMMLKIVAFLAWQHRYAGRVGRDPTGAARVPMLAEMTVPALAWTTAAGLVLAALLVAVARIAGPGPAVTPPSWTLATARAGALAGSVGAWALVAHLAWIVAGRHGVKADAHPAGARSAAHGPAAAEPRP